MKKQKRKIIINIVASLILLLIVVPTHAHDIDNPSNRLNIIPLSIEFQERVHKDKPHHCADGVCEGRLVNSCFANPQINFQFRTMQEINKNFWHWRRQLIAQLFLLAGETNFARGIFLGKHRRESQIPFLHYDPFYLGHDPHFPKIFKNFKQETGLDPYSALEMRYDLFSIAHVIEFPGFNNTLLKFKTCGAATAMEKMHAPECIGASKDRVILVGGDSYKVPSPFRDEDGFIYYDRIPASPIDDACMGWKDGRWGFGFAMLYAEAHEIAGKNHATEVFKRLIYIRKVIDQILRRR